LFWLRVCCGVTVNITGIENVPKTPVVVISNHQSEWETIFLYYLAAPVCPILKKELLNIPFWGWAMRLQKPIAIDRKKPHEALRSLLIQGKDRIQNLRLSVVIFPEGTRTQPGSVRKFTRGGATLAKETETPILPIAHDAGYCWPPRQITKYPGEINICIGNLVYAGEQSPKEITEGIEEWVRTTLAVSVVQGTRL